MNDGVAIARSLEDPEEFAVIFDRHFDEIHRYLRRRRPADADDLASEVFAIAFDNRARYRPLGDSSRPWLYGIAANVLARRRRSEARGLRAYARTGGIAPTATDEFDDAVDRADAGRRSAEVAGALASLKPADRETLLLYALGDLSYEEVAFALEVPIGTVRSRLSRVRRQCSKELGLSAAGENLSLGGQCGD